MSGAQEEDPSIFGMIRQSRRHRRSWRTSELPSIAVLARYRRRSKRYRPRSIDRRLGRSASSRGPIPIVSSDWAPPGRGEIRRRARVRCHPHRAGSRCGRPGPTRGAGFHGGDHRRAGRRALAQGGKALDPDPRRISGAGPLPGRTHHRPTSRQAPVFGSSWPRPRKSLSNGPAPYRSVVRPEPWVALTTRVATASSLPCGSLCDPARCRPSPRRTASHKSVASVR